MCILLSLSLLVATITHSALAADPPRPEIASVANAGYFSIYGFAPGSLVTIYGQKLADSTAAADATPLPKKLADVEVSLCRRTESSRICTPMELVFVSPMQINFLLRYTYIDSAPVGLIVSNKGVLDVMAASGPRALTSTYLNWISPGVFAAGFDCPVNRLDISCTFSSSRTHVGQVIRGTITDTNYRLITSANPGKLGGTYTAWMTGLGYDGQVGDLKSRLGLRIRIGLRPPEQDLSSIADAVMTYAGASLDFPGLYQINFQIPMEIVRLTNICAVRQAEIWLTLFGAGTSAGIPVPIQASPGDQVCR